MEGFDRLKREVIDVGLCTFCGTCVGVCKSESLSIKYEIEEPELLKSCDNCGLCWQACPGKDVNFPNLEKMLFGKERDLENESNFGILRKCYKGYATNEEIREFCTAGGIVSALLMYGFELGVIDGAVVAGMDDDLSYRAVPKVIMGTGEVLSTASSKYMAVPNNAVLNIVRKRGLKKIAIVGCPCHVQALRKMFLSKKFKDLTQRIVFIIGLFCGINYYFKATEHLIAEHLGVPLDRVGKLEYTRSEFSGEFFKVTTKNGVIKSVTSPQRRNFFLTFQRDRCQMCMDFTSELADISIGGFFHPNIVRGSPGWSAIISRTKEGDKILYGAKKNKFIEIFPIKEMIMLNNIGFEFKKHGAIYHLIERRRHNWPVPNYHYPIEVKIIKRKVVFNHPHVT